MHRFLAAALAASAAVIVLGACDDQDGHGRYGQRMNEYCGQFRSCGTCTPTYGCGWCYASDGTGTCVSDPDQCTGQTFSWTWEPSGCREAAEAGVGGDAAAPPDGAFQVAPDASALGDARGDGPLP